MTDRDVLLQQITDDVRALVEPRRHVEPYRHIDPSTRRVRWLAHTTDQPSLLDQLRAGGAATGPDGGGTRSFESKPPTALDCLDRLMAIEAGSAWWVSVQVGAPLREDAEGNLRALVGVSTTMAEPGGAYLRELAYDVHRWHGWAVVLTGWKTPPFRPRASCPVCSSRRGTLRVRPDERTAACLQCGATWDSPTFGILVDHIRSEGEQADTPNESGVAS